MSSKISHNIKHRENPKDVFITPDDLAKKHINICRQNLYKDGWEKTLWYDPFKNSGVYYNNYFDDQRKDWAEILEDRDFFKYVPELEKDEKLVVCSNPPYSMIDNVLKRCCELKSYTVSLLLAFHALTPKRIEMMEKNGYRLSHIHLCKVFKWYGMSAIVEFENIYQKNCDWSRHLQDKWEGEKYEMNFTYDRKVWRN